MLVRRNVVLMAAAAVGGFCVPTAARASLEFAAILEGDGSAGMRIDASLRQLVTELETDRAFVYMRNPETRQVGYTHLFTTLSNWGGLPLGHWSDERPLDRISDPLLRSAYQSDAAHFIDDIETAPPGKLNLALERSYFGHRALIHAPLYSGGIFFGILETAVRNRPRQWEPEARALIVWLQPRMAELCRDFLSS